MMISAIENMAEKSVRPILTYADEAHKSGAESYQKIIDYYKPGFCLGMTASPERTDGYDVYRLFDNNIAYEIRLRQAMEEDLLCPFHYFGITDLEINGEEIDDKSRFNLITCDDRVDYVLRQAQFYGYGGERVKGLVFCSWIISSRSIFSMKELISLK